ncbi:hypothetical protein [uncultured Campylobacter sp.]|uniref:hypothetical protein n=1 Tax=uncultured Campylobacter sp. TaxID=218934 RepID=UPI0026217D14|nr:hypothetical protein [uncultured Campylobacter sp.]
MAAKRLDGFAALATAAAAIKGVVSAAAMRQRWQDLRYTISDDRIFDRNTCSGDKILIETIGSSGG